MKNSNIDCVSIMIYCRVAPHTSAKARLQTSAKREDGLANSIRITEHILVVHNETNRGELRHAYLKLDNLYMIMSAEINQIRALKPD